MTSFDLYALGVLASCHDLVRPQHFGTLLWPTSHGPGGCSAPLARPAGKVLARLALDGLAEWRAPRHRGDPWGWRITAAGRSAVHAQKEES